MWPFTTVPDRHVLTIPLVIAIHVLAGISTAGVVLCSWNIALELAPRGRATAYLASSALVNGAAATLAPVIGGVIADLLATRRLSLLFRWVSRSQQTEFPAFDLMGLDFVFVVAVAIGLYASALLLAVREEGEVEERIVINELYTEARKAVRSVSSIAGLRRLTYFPYARLLKRQE